MDIGIAILIVGILLFAGLMVQSVGLIWFWKEQNRQNEERLSYSRKLFPYEETHWRKQAEISAKEADILRGLGSE